MKKLFKGERVDDFERVDELFQVPFFFRPKRDRVRDFSRGFFSLPFLVERPLRSSWFSSSSSAYFALCILEYRQRSVRTSVEQPANSPAITHHAQALRFRHSVVLSCLLEVFLASHALGVAESRLGHGVAIAPARRYFEAT